MIRAALTIMLLAALAVFAPRGVADEAFDPVGDLIYMQCPDLIMRAIRVAEGVPSYGLMNLARAYSSHRAVPEKVGRAAAGKLLHKIHGKWIDAGRPIRFLFFLQRTWAPIWAKNDPHGLNWNWLKHVGQYIAENTCR